MSKPVTNVFYLSAVNQHSMPDSPRARVVADWAKHMPSRTVHQHSHVHCELDVAPTEAVVRLLEHAAQSAQTPPADQLPTAQVSHVEPPVPARQVYTAKWRVGNGRAGRLAGWLDRKPVDEDGRVQTRDPLQSKHVLLYACGDRTRCWMETRGQW